MIHIDSKEQFDREVLQAEQPILADFYADWCGPCKAMAPVLEEMDREEKAFGIAEVDVEKLPELAAAYQVASIPTVLVFREGACVERSVGLSSREELENLI